MTSTQTRRVELWVEPRGGTPAVNPVMRRLLRSLEGDGTVVRVRVPEHEVMDEHGLLDAERLDLVLLKSATTLSLSVAVAGESSGIPFLNGARATLRAHDKAATVARLAAAGLPVPESFLFQPEQKAGTAPHARDVAWVSKPVRGVHGRGVAFHSQFPETLGATPVSGGEPSYVVDDGTRLLQRRVGGEEADVKVYIAGERIFAGSKAFGPSSYAEDGVSPVVLDKKVVGVVRAVGEALGLRLFGVDLRFEGDESFVIDANPFPGYRGFPKAVEALREEIMHFLEKEK